MENKRGITLVALVVTIVVLLILAGVSISLVLGENGLINNAKEARNKTLEAEKTEGESLNTAEHYINQITGVNASGITADDYGKVVTNYQENSSNIWEIFYSDETNVYLIMRNSSIEKNLCEEITKANATNYKGTSDFDGSENFKSIYPAIQRGWLNKVYKITGNEENGVLLYESENKNMKSSEYLLDVRNWSEYKTNKADWVIGTPTLEMFVTAYNKYINKNITIPELNENGYKYDDELYKNESVGKSDDIVTGIDKCKNVFNHGYSYWLACPSSNTNYDVRYVEYTNSNVKAHDYSSSHAIRPVVCLNSSVKLIESDDENTFTIK